METKVKVFAEFQERSLEKDINDFLGSIEFDGGKLIDIKFSCAYAADQNANHELYSAIVIYQLPEIRNKRL